ncbi:MAG: hypothetical protein M1817_005264 [Caeruleum heppii]|nr:MAG: hypothetical protein M1817_005264 [Caeruleum heppii]
MVLHASEKAMAPNTNFSHSPLAQSPSTPASNPDTSRQSSRVSSFAASDTSSLSDPNSPILHSIKLADLGRSPFPHTDASQHSQEYFDRPDAAKRHPSATFDEASGSATAVGVASYTSRDEQAVVTKFDRRLVLFVALLYLLSFLDRSNIGNARIAGLERDLHLSSRQYEWLLTAFYLTYILFEWMTLLYREAAFGPGVPFYLSFFYKRQELALRTGLFISAAPLATSFASSLAWLIIKLGHGSLIAPWRLLFLVEGFPSVVVAAIAWVVIPDSPDKASYLTRRERRVAKLRLQGDKSAHEEKSGLNWRHIFQTLTDPKCYLTALMFFSCNVAFSSLPVFLPTIISEMGHSSQSSQALSAPPYLLAFAIVILTAFLSDRLRSRSLFVCVHALLGASGYALIAVAGWRNWSATWRYVGVYPAAAGFFSAITIIITWTINNQDSDSKKGTGVAMLNIIGQCGPLVGTRLYPDEDKPLYIKGMAVCAGFMMVVFALSVVLRLLLDRENRRRACMYVEAEMATDPGAIGGRFRYIL